MSEKRQEQPFRRLGESLKGIRRKLQETVAEVSGAVEIDESVLQEFEQGRARPTEDILMLLISHFNMRDDDAESLWALAGYDPARLRGEVDAEEPPQQNRNTLLVMAVDPRVIYSDGVHVQAGPSGVVLNFGQSTGSPRQPLIISRIGMSRDQAYNVLNALTDALSHSEPRQLPFEGQEKNQK
jgi:transcriptional regulator with XRE-family HTH domain